MTRTGDNDQPVGSPTFGLIEAGGTKFVVGVARGGELGASTRIETRDPDDTLAAVIGWLSAQAQAVGHFDGIGIASFGPLDLDPASATWGHINRTPKQGWSGTDIAGRLGRAFHCPVAIDTDGTAFVPSDVISPSPSSAWPGPPSFLCTGRTAFPVARYRS